ncbi:MAG: YigZ family protein [Bifidobacteriaceae bacterium]|nr:YigZ family protein [Bifidobacteriaceae bacterium]
MINKSRFLALLVPVDSLDAATAVVQERRREHYQARHHCSAVIVGEGGAQQRSSDDGEPSGTAGVPMLEVLRRRRVTGVVAVVTRYFGGILLGAGGLVRAYSGAVAGALDAARFFRLEPRTAWSVEADPATAGKLDHELRHWLATRGGNPSAIQTDYGPRVTFRLDLPPSDAAAFRAFAEAAGVSAVEGGTRTVRLR